MLAVLMIIGGVLLRLVPHMPNFAPIAATALFGGAYLNKRFAILVPLLAIAISDYLLLYINPFGNPVFDLSTIHPLSAMFHDTTVFVWGSIMVAGLIGMFLKNRKKPSNVLASSIANSVQFFLITNFGVWAMGAYSRGLDGLMTSYIMGLPFFRWTFLGDLFYTFVFFGAYELAYFVAKKSKPAAAIV